MNLKDTAKRMETLIMERQDELALPSRDTEIGVNHLKWMCRQIYNSQVSGQTGAMWLGYVQGAVRASGGANLKEIYEIIKSPPETKSPHRS